ncbi:hypothetical protein M9H77_30439 [Catharanthus roseus]|uniref:Uncharacterized protein n=1 Tax=Catharanthus roseus TaxID=4058 RepID=A0ACB9ZZV8_CATRO|nr:hypothetical protein M9H77_30439 [Catharanthus roseus]
MEEVPTHVHPSPIVPDVVSLPLFRIQGQEGTFGSMDLESFIWLPYLDRALVPSDLWRAEHASHVEAGLQWRLRVRDGPALAVETSILHEVDDMASVLIQEPPTDPS